MDTPTRKDYSLHLPQLPKTDSYHEMMKRAHRVIHLLSLHADQVVEESYTFQQQQIRLPRAYYFGNVPVCFLPGWGSYTLGDRKSFIVTFHLPHGYDELLSDVESTKEFLARYTSLKGKSAKQKAEDAWKRKMGKRIA